jgi:hypothetical protein
MNWLLAKCEMAVRDSRQEIPKGRNFVEIVIDDFPERYGTLVKMQMEDRQRMIRKINRLHNAQASIRLSG